MARTLLEKPPARTGRRPAAPRRPTARTVDVAGKRIWSAGPVLDQGNLGACIGFSWAGALLTEPGDTTATVEQGNDLGIAIWKHALATADAATYAIDRGILDQATEATSLDEIRDAILTSGPVLICVPWYASMWSTAADGLVKVKITPTPAGWHQVLLRGYHPDVELSDGTGPAFLLRNSWGEDYGISRDRGTRPRRPVRKRRGKRTRRQWRHSWRRRLRRWRRRIMRQPTGRTGDAWIRPDDIERLIEANGGGWQVATIPVGRQPFDVADLLDQA